MSIRLCLQPPRPVALRKESVDRNHDMNLDWIIEALSLSARRAWIEIICPLRGTGPAIVALRKESVDRNILSKSAIVDLLTSLSARRAWIEIRLRLTVSYMFASLSARRAWIEIMGLDGRFKL